MASSLVTVTDLMSGPDLEWAETNETCVDAAQKMIKRSVGALPVKDAQGKLCGIVTDRDVVTRILAAGLDPSKQKITAAMTSPPLITVLDTDTMETAQKAMVNGDVRRLIVRSRSSGDVVGILTVDDLARAGLKRAAGQVIRETAVLHRERQSIPAVTVAGDLSSGSSSDAADNTVSLAVNRLFEWVDEFDTCRTAALRMLHRNVGVLPVCKSGKPGKLIGMLTDRDIVVRVVAANLDVDRTLVKDVMSTDLRWCFIDDRLADAQHVMIQFGVRRLPVLLRSTHELLGILSVDDIALWSSRGRAGAVLRAAVQSAAPAEFPQSSAAFQPTYA